MKEEEPKKHLWTMHFDGAASREGVGVWIVSPVVGKARLYSYKLVFYYTNNMEEYEALLWV